MTIYVQIMPNPFDPAPSYTPETFWHGSCSYDGETRKAEMTKVTTENFSMDHKKDGMSNLSVATRRVTTENAPISDFCDP